MGEMTLEQKRALALARARARAAADHSRMTPSKQAKLEAIAARRAAPSGPGALLEGIGQGAGDVINTGLDWLGRGLEATGVPYVEGAGKGLRKAITTSRDFDAIMDTKARATKPNWYAAGKLMGEATATVPVTNAAGGALIKGGKVLAKVAPPVSNLAQNVGRATIASGFADVGAVSRAMGGALSGALTAAMTGQDAGTGAGIGALLPTSTSLVSGPLGALVDYATGRFGKTKAAEILRKEVASRIDEVKTALANGGTNARLNVAEFLAAKGIDIPELSALVVDLEKSTSNAPLLATAQRRTADVLDMRAGLRGGATATEAQTGRQFGKMALNDATDPMRTQALGAADVGRTQIVPLEAEAAQLGREAADKGEAASRRLPMFQHASDYMGVPAGAHVADKFAADASFAADDAAAAAQKANTMAQNLRAQGLKPLDVSAVTARLRAGADNAEYANTDRFKLLNDLAGRIEARAAKFGGIIDADGLYEIRKNIGANIESLLGARTGEALKNHTADLVKEAQPLIDDAIEAAGGQGWGQYLKTFSAGMRDLERQKFSATLADLPEKQVVEVMAGKHPEFVEDFFGPGRFNINVELMGGKLPQAQELASTYKAGHDVTAMGMGDISPDAQARFTQGVTRNTQKAMSPGLPNVFVRGLARMVGGRALPFGGGVATAQAEDAFANKLYESVRAKLAEGLASPAETNMLLEMFSTPQMTRQLMERNPLLMRGAQGATINAFAQPTEYQY